MLKLVVNLCYNTYLKIKSPIIQVQNELIRFQYKHRLYFKNGMK